ncbi:uncharacterized protein LAESUDRAFT_815751 [Laetiporus sulphureus 93-53]|uniref:DUF6534 domain-containing protein n=1 Tax=Laetiporus sulphureus 93-53 TaxID=1314785 RepID=A0A165BUU2_9APHY|nr:uncharacterized protein LAESUDRAFT_815751 [Laetiporus sulphureus 93-53]KZT01696.1 hypothetical protein LAESUDRAFT_815751 [Laetiporus sulphureus 93-53]
MAFVFYKGSLLFLGMAAVQGKLYANSFLATLNARQHLNSPRGIAAGDAITIGSLLKRLPGEIGTRHQEIYQTVTKATHDDSAQGIDVGSSVTEVPSMWIWAWTARTGAKSKFWSNPDAMTVIECSQGSHGLM